jgi:hypothetical protein
MGESPLFVKTHDLILWLIPATEKFPKSQRFVLAKRLQDAVLDFYACLIEARKVSVAQRGTVLLRADVELEKLRLSLRLCRELKLLGPDQYAHASRAVVEVGKLLGAWRKRYPCNGNSGSDAP